MNTQPTQEGSEKEQNYPQTIRKESAERLKVLFLCTGNSCRSQMAEGWAIHLKSDTIEAYSAGTKPHGLNRIAVNIMLQSGVDISNHGSKKIARLEGIDFDYVVTVCDNAQESCPVFPGKAKVVHKSFDDPPRLAETAGSEEEALDHYRRVCEEIRAFVETLPESLHALHQKQGPGSQQMSLGI
jgi:arsenate reductase